VVGVGPPSPTGAGLGCGFAREARFALSGALIRRASPATFSPREKGNARLNLVVKRSIAYCAGCASGRAFAFARTATPKRRRRSVSDSTPPSAIAAPPSQINVTRGFQ
jgi:hypothetical protein